MNKMQRNFIIGDNWVYYKIYTGKKTADTILIEIINPIATLLIEEKVIDKWFFIRYGDPEHHLRIRFHCLDKNNIGGVMNKFLPRFTELLNEDIIWKIQSDTYKRELERYGENTMEFSETLFFYDSLLTVSILDIIGNEDEELRWLFALKTVDNLLNNFGYSLDKKLNLFEQLKNGFGQEFGIDKNVNKQIDLKYRNYRYQIDSLLNLNNNSQSEFFKIIEILDHFNTNIRPVVDKILDYNNSNLLMPDLNNLLISYIHMSMVRLFKSKNRLHELVIYDFLYRYYKSSTARKAYLKQQNS